jgi:NTE family protein
VGSKTGHPEKDLEDFWMEIGESTSNIIPDIFTYDWDRHAKRYVTKKISSASANAAVFGVPKMFVPRWLQQQPQWWSWWWGDVVGGGDGNGGDGNNESINDMMTGGNSFNPKNWTYVYDNSPLEKTLDKYIDYKKLNLAATKEELPSVLRLIITAVDVMTGKPLVFDNTQTEINAKHILASSGYPIYGFPWTKVEDSVYAWDGSLLSNTPIREVL